MTPPQANTVPAPCLHLAGQMVQLWTLVRLKPVSTRRKSGHIAPAERVYSAGAR